MIDQRGTTVVILNYVNHADTIACLRSVYASGGHFGRIIIVDNNSRDGSVGTIAEAWKEMEPSVVVHTVSAATPVDDVAPVEESRAVLLVLPQNDGYAAGNNAGIRLALRDAACRAVWILNNDTEAQPGALAALCDRLNARPDAGMAGSTLIYAHNRESIQCAAGFFFTPWLGTTTPCLGGTPLAALASLAPEAAERSLSYISGASLLVRREVFERVGLLAEEYFLYYEDTEFSLRAAKAGYALAWARESVVCHKEGGTTGAVSQWSGRQVARSPLMDYLALRNRVYTVRLTAPYALPVVLLSYLGVMAYRIRRGQTDRLPLVCRAAWHGLLGKMGKPPEVE